MQFDHGTKTAAVSARIFALSSHVSSIIVKTLNQKLLSQITKYVSYQLKLFFIFYLDYLTQFNAFSLPVCF